MKKSKVMIEYCLENNIPFVLHPAIKEEDVTKFLGMPSIKPTKEREKMEIGKTRYLTLKDRKRQPRVIISALEYVTVHGYVDVAWGIAIRSDDDKHSIDDGKRLAYARAVRAIKGRKPCYVSRQEAIRNIWQLGFRDYQKLMRLTGGLTSDFTKGNCGLYDSIEDFMEDIHYVG